MYCSLYFSSDLTSSSRVNFCSFLVHCLLVHVAGGLGEGGEGHGGEVEAVQGARQQRRGDAEGSRKHRRRGKTQPLQFGLLEPLGLGPPVLEPDLDLCLGELELGGELGPLGDGQVLLLPELLLQAVQLLGRERRSRLPVRLVLPQRAA